MQRGYFFRGTTKHRLVSMEEEQEMVARLQRDAANDVILENYSYLVGCINAILILPYLVESGLVNQDFRQRLEGERTDTDKMMALLRELTRSPMEGWFKEFIGALSKISQYNTVVGNLLKGALCRPAMQIPVVQCFRKGMREGGHFFLFY